jgi:hypothetical protein
MTDMKPLPDRDPARATLAAAIALEAGARRDLKVAQSAADLAQRRHWDAQSKIDELRKVVAAPTGALADAFASSVAAGEPCNVAVLERSAIDARAKLVAAENEVAVWDETRLECELAVRSKAADVAAAKERVTRAARVVVCNAETVSHLADELAALQSELISRRSVLRFIWRTNRNGELSVPLAGRIERLLLCDLTGLESTPASAAWSAAFDELLTNSEAELPTEFAGAV